MNKRKKLPIGIESFEEMRKEDFIMLIKRDGSSSFSPSGER